MQQEVQHILQPLSALTEISAQMQDLQNNLTQRQTEIHRLEASLTATQKKRATGKTKALIESLSAQLADLCNGNGYRQRILWQDQLDSLSARKKDILLQNQEILAPLPESCCQPQALIFICNALASNQAQTLPGAVRLWELSSEKSALQQKLGAIVSENLANKNQLYHDIREKANQDAGDGVGYIVLDSILDSIFG